MQPEMEGGPARCLDRPVGTRAPLLGRRRARGKADRLRRLRTRHAALPSRGRVRGSSLRLPLPLAGMGMVARRLRGAHRARRTPRPAQIELLFLWQHQARRGAGAFNRGAAHHCVDGSASQASPSQCRGPVAQAGAWPSRCDAASRQHHRVHPRTRPPIIGRSRPHHRDGALGATRFSGRAGRTSP